MQKCINERLAAEPTKDVNDLPTNNASSHQELFELMPPDIGRPRILPTSPPATSTTTSSSGHDWPFATCKLVGCASSVEGCLGERRHAFECCVLASAPNKVVQGRDLTREITTVEQYAVACGGCSNIYRGEWAQSKGARNADRTIPVALKVLRTSRGKRDPVRVQERLSKEVKILLRLDHPNIVKLHGVAFVLGGEPAMVMKWYKNGTVTAFAQSQSVACRLRLVKEACAGVKYLHSLEPPVVHGDLKGDNILINDDGHAMLSDFGLSSEIQEHAQDSVGGSLRWLAPELLFDAAGDEEDGYGWSCSLTPSVASDVWSFGCTAYEILLCRLPYHDRQLNWAIIQDIMRGIGPVKSDDTLIHGSRGLSSLLDECWSLRPWDRPDIVEVTLRLGVVFL